MLRDVVAFFLLLLILASCVMHDGPLLPPSLWLGVFVAGVMLRERNAHRRRQLIEQLVNLRERLERGETIAIDDRRYRLRTELSTYRMSVGALITSINVESLYHAPEGEDSAEGLFYSIISLLTGWWALPFGPIYTLGFVTSNLRGGVRTTVEDLLSPNAKAQEKLETQNAQHAANQDIVKATPTSTTEQSTHAHFPDTGPGSRSAKHLKRRRPPTAPTNEERIRAFERPGSFVQRGYQALKRKLFQRDWELPPKHPPCRHEAKPPPASTAAAPDSQKTAEQKDKDPN